MKHLLALLSVAILLSCSNSIKPKKVFTKRYIINARVENALLFSANVEFEVDTIYFIKDENMYFISDGVEDMTVPKDVIHGYKLNPNYKK